VRKLKLSAAVRPLMEYVTNLRDETVLVTQGKRAVAAIVPLKNVDRESLALSQHPEFLDLIARSRADFAAGRTLSMDEMKRRLRTVTPRARRAPRTTRPRRPG
jgi:antitoxin (DNA-binding transcriptional repressor) of toxin-antitoxin stability system